MRAAKDWRMGLLRSLVLDSHRPDGMAETADSYGPVKSASLGVMVSVP